MRRYSIVALLSLCVACSSPTKQADDALWEEWGPLFVQIDPEVRRLLNDSQKARPRVWAAPDAKLAYTTPEGIGLPKSDRPSPSVVAHELAHWHNPHVGRLPAIVEEGVALSVVYHLGLSNLAAPPVLEPPYDEALEALTLSYEEFLARPVEERWRLVTLGFAIVDRIGLERLIVLSDVSSEALAEAAHMR